MAEQLVPKNQSLRIERFEYRLVYEKTGIAKYISHLDLMRVMQRVFKRARIPLWYTQGFNPHSYLMFPLALPLGTESTVEILDVALVEELPFDEIKDRLNEKMPGGLVIVSVAKPVMKHTEIAAAEYEISLTSDISAEKLCERFNSFLSRERIEIEKRSKKRGVNLVDIKPHIKLVSVAVKNGSLLLDMILPSGSEFNLNTGVVIDAFCAMENVKIDDICTKRTKITTKSGDNFI